MRVIDFHRHYWGKGWDSMPRMRHYYRRDGGGLSFEEFEKQKYQTDESKMLKEMDILGIDTVVIHTTDTGLEYHEDSPTPIEEINRFNCEMARKYPGKVYALFGIDPRRPGGVKLFEKAVKEWGAVGLSLYPSAGFYINDRICYPYYQKCIDLGVVVTCHTGFQHESRGLAKYSDPILWDDVAYDLPDLIAVMNHAGLDVDPSEHAWETAVCVAYTKPNLYLDVADWQRSESSKPHVLDDMRGLFRKLKIMRDRVGAHRILFGTDMPSYHQNPAVVERDLKLTRQWVELFKNLPEEGKKYGVDFSQQEAELMLHGNAENLLKRQDAK